MDYAVITMAGRMVAAPVKRKNSDGREYGTFSLAVNSKYGQEDVVSFYNCNTSGAQCDGMIKAGVTKGSSISLTGNLLIRTYKNKSGQVREAANVKMLDWRYSGPRIKNEHQDANTAEKQSGYAEPPRQNTGYGTAYSNVELNDPEDLPL